MVDIHVRPGRALDCCTCVDHRRGPRERSRANAVAHERDGVPFFEGVDVPRSARQVRARVVRRNVASAGRLLEEDERDGIGEGRFAPDREGVGVRLGVLEELERHGRMRAGSCGPVWRGSCADDAEHELPKAGQCTCEED